MAAILSEYNVTREIQLLSLDTFHKELLLNKKNFQKLFREKIYTPDPSVTTLICIWKQECKSTRRILIKKLKGPCFGISRALLEISRGVPFTIQEFINKALYYSLLDIVREKYFKTVTLPPENSEFYSVYANECLPYYKTFKGSSFLSDFEGFIFNSPSQAYLLSVWSVQQHVYSTCHSFFIGAGMHNNTYVISDTGLQTYYVEKDRDKYRMFVNAHITTFYRECLTNEYVWRFLWRN